VGLSYYQRGTAGLGWPDGSPTKAWEGTELAGGGAAIGGLGWPAAVTNLAAHGTRSPGPPAGPSTTPEPRSKTRPASPDQPRHESSRSAPRSDYLRPSPFAGNIPLVARQFRKERAPEPQVEDKLDLTVGPDGTIKLPDFPFCGIVPPYVKQMMIGSTLKRVFHPGAVVFTDAVIWIYPPVPTRLFDAARTAALGGAQLATTSPSSQPIWKETRPQSGFTHGVDIGTSFSDNTVDGRVERINKQLAAFFKNRDLLTLTSEDVIDELGDWAHVWPNSTVVRAKMKKAMLRNRWTVTVKPRSGMSMGWQVDGQEAGDECDAVLTKAFGSRYSRVG